MGTLNFLDLAVLVEVVFAVNAIYYKLEKYKKIEGIGTKYSSHYLKKAIYGDKIFWKSRILVICSYFLRKGCDRCLVLIFGIAFPLTMLLLFIAYDGGKSCYLFCLFPFFYQKIFWWYSYYFLCAVLVMVVFFFVLRFQWQKKAVERMKEFTETFKENEKKELDNFK